MPRRPRSRPTVAALLAAVLAGSAIAGWGVASLLADGATAPPDVAISAGGATTTSPPPAPAPAPPSPERPAARTTQAAPSPQPQAEADPRAGAPDGPARTTTAAAPAPAPPRAAPARRPRAAAATDEAPGPPAAATSEPDPGPQVDPAPPAAAPPPPATTAAAPDPEPRPQPEIPVPDGPLPPDPGQPLPPPAEGPPPAVLAPAAELPAPGTSWGTLVRLHSAAAAGSQEREDLAWALELGRRHATDGPEGRRRTVTRALRIDAWWFSRYGSPQRRVLVRDPDGVILTYRRGHGFTVNPVATTGRWQGLNDDLPSEGLAAPLLTMAVERRAGDRAFLAWEYFDVADRPLEIRPGVSAMAQARLAENLAHAYRRTGEARFAQGALGALAAFTISVDEGGVTSRVGAPGASRDHPWYVERAYPGDDPWKGAALNGFMVALLSLRGASAVLADGPPAEGAADAAAAPVAAHASQLARSLADRGVETLLRFLPLHDSGEWSYYGLLTPGRPWRTYLADLNYHCYHVGLLERLDTLYPGKGLGETAARWAGYVSSAGETCPER